MKKIYTPTNARDNLFKILKDVNTEKKPITIVSTKNNNEDAVIIGKRDWDAIQETLHLMNTGVVDQIEDRKNDNFEDFDRVWEEI